MPLFSRLMPGVNQIEIQRDFLVVVVVVVVFAHPPQAWDLSRPDVYLFSFPSDDSVYKAKLFLLFPIGFCVLFIVGHKSHPSTDLLPMTQVIFDDYQRIDSLAEVSVGLNVSWGRRPEGWGRVFWKVKGSRASMEPPKRKT